MAGRLLEPVVFLCCDLQTAFRNKVYRYEAVITAAQKMIKAAEVLEAPVIVTTQYAQRLGSTVEDIILPSTASVIDKMDFSMCTSEVVGKLAQLGAKTVILFGIESHVCVLQTTLDLLERGQHAVHVLQDGVSSVHPEEIPIALARMRAAGAVISTTESTLFELMRTARHPHFKALSKLVKDMPTWQ